MPPKGASTSLWRSRSRSRHGFLKEAIQASRFGKLINVNVSVRWYRKPEYYSASPWHGTLALDGGGALMNQGIHYVDLMQWLAGPVDSVFAYTGTLLHRPMAFAMENHCRQIARVAEAIETAAPVDVDGREARKSVSIIEAIYRSAATHAEQALR